ncbi:MAG: methyltransferase domain-containing protein [Pseudomonadota bacterium]
MIKKIIRSIVTDIGTNNEKVRHEWVVNKLASLPVGYTIIDTGAGEQRYKKYCDHLHYISQDICQYSGSGDDGGLHSGKWNTCNTDIISDITDIPIACNSVDAILCTEVLEHITDPILAIREFHRILRDDGIIIITSPFNSLTHMAPYHYYSGFNKYFFIYHLQKNGFEITEIMANGNYYEYQGQEIRRILSAYDAVPVYVKLCIGVLLSYLGRKRGRGDENYDSDINCFGYHVAAKKIRSN